MRTLRSTIFVALMATLVVYAAISYHLRRQVLDGYSDFISFYTAGKILQSGTPEKLYDLEVQYEIQNCDASSETYTGTSANLSGPGFPFLDFLLPCLYRAAARAGLHIVSLGLSVCVHSAMERE